MSKNKTRVSMAKRIANGLFYSTGVVCKKIGNLTELKKISKKTKDTLPKKERKSFKTAADNDKKIFSKPKITVEEITELPPADETTQIQDDIVSYEVPEPDDVKVIPMKPIKRKTTSSNTKKPKSTTTKAASKKTASKAKKSSSTKKIMNADFMKEKGKIDLKNFG